MEIFWDILGKVLVTYTKNFRFPGEIEELHEHVIRVFVPCFDSSPHIYKYYVGF